MSCGTAAQFRSFCNELLRKRRAAGTALTAPKNQSGVAPMSEARSREARSREARSREARFALPRRKLYAPLPRLPPLGSCLTCMKLQKRVQILVPPAPKGHG